MNELDQMTDEEVSELFEDACVGTIFWKYLEELEQMEVMPDEVKRMLEEFYDFMASVDETVH